MNEKSFIKVKWTWIGIMVDRVKKKIWFDILSRIIWKLLVKKVRNSFLKVVTTCNIEGKSIDKYVMEEKTELFLNQRERFEFNDLIYG
jgi:hypothetical protein